MDVMFFLFNVNSYEIETFKLKWYISYKQLVM